MARSVPSEPRLKPSSPKCVATRRGKRRPTYTTYPETEIHHGEQSRRGHHRSWPSRVSTQTDLFHFDNDQGQCRQTSVLLADKLANRLALANCFNGSSLKVRLFEKRLTRAKAGRADGLKFLTLEIFDALGIFDHVMSEACRHEEICHWSPGEDGTLQRLARVPDIVPGLDEPREVTLAQGKITTP